MLKDRLRTWQRADEIMADVDRLAGLLEGELRIVPIGDWVVDD